MDDARFWNLIEDGTTPDDLHRALATLSDGELAAFERRHDQLMRRAYDWGLWGAAYVIDGGCSDDGFEYFRSMLIAQGSTIYEQALKSPDSLADIDLPDSEEWEDWMSPTMQVIHARTGRYEFAAPPDPNRAPLGQPSGVEWDDDDLPQRFPHLSARYDF